MPNTLNNDLNQLFTRVSRLEQKGVFSISGVAHVGYDEATNTTTVNDHLNWGLAGTRWEPFSKVSNISYDSETGMITGGGELSTPYGRPEAHLLGGMCVLNGLVRLKAGTPNLNAGTRYDLPMFGLPLNWRPMTHVPLLCLMGNGDPDPLAASPTGVVSTAWVEIRPGLEPLQESGIVYYVSGTSPLTAGTGWISLQGVFPSYIVDATGF